MLPLKKDLNGDILPIKNKNMEKVPSWEDILFFFEHCFAPKEERFKVILLTQLGCACRIAEACAINLDDFHKESNFRKVDMLIQKKVKDIKSKDGKLKTIGKNEIYTKDIPESIACILRQWIKKNLRAIIYHDGYIFCPNPMQKKTPFYSPDSVSHFMDHKREQLVRLFPYRGFDRIIGWRNYKKPKMLNGHVAQLGKSPIHMWTTHLMKRTAGTYHYLLEKDVMATKNFLAHTKSSTTEQHYIDIARVIDNNRHLKSVNKLFDRDFYDKIKGQKSDIPAVWELLDKI